MAVCNIFNTLTKKTGTFLTFSQYTEDLTVWQTESKYHKITPSRFVAIDIPELRLNNTGAQLNNESFPRYLQDVFENACAYFKNNFYAQGWDPEYAKTLFWNAMFGIDANSSDTYHCPGIMSIDNIKYTGDVNLQSYNTVDGMGYSEIYCHIPNDAKSYRYSYIQSYYPTSLTYRIDKGKELEGHTDLQLTVSDNYLYQLQSKYIFSWEDKTLSTIEKSDESFNINMIVVLYDIWNDNQILAKDVPMGIYLTGAIENGVMQNSITKFVSNEETYHTGTSYGLRICSRYVVGVGDHYLTPEVTVEDNNYGELTRVLSQMSISQNKMDEIVSKKYVNDQNYKDLLAIFKNTQTNVPYIKEVNGKEYWFVNGKILHSSSTQDNNTSDCEPYRNYELDAYLGHRQLLMRLSTSYQNDDTSSPSISTTKIRMFDRFTPLPAEAVCYINWKAMYDFEQQHLSDINMFSFIHTPPLIPTNNIANNELFIADNEVDINNNRWVIKRPKGSNQSGIDRIWLPEKHIKENDKGNWGLSGNDSLYDVPATHTFDIRVAYNGSSTIATTIIKFVFPSFFGQHVNLVSSLDENDVALNNIINIINANFYEGTADAVQGWKMNTIDSKQQDFIINPPVDTTQVTTGTGEIEFADAVTAESRYIYYLYPKMFGQLQSITDEHRTEYFKDFKCHTIYLKYDYLKSGSEEKGLTLVDNTVDGAISYYLYVNSNGPVSVNNKFIYFQ